ncbi:MAG TPA: hypothetical protein VH189_02815 [Rhizomicrobium sp.]|jgi:hypothetical protein|nr:hypothetical protein [Rhizomicrobium sp.]
MIRINPIFPGLTRVMPLALAAGLLAACMGPTPYQPRLEGQQTGYTDHALTQNRYRVTFTGNSATPRETVESYLLLRAAEVTRAAGYNNFVFDTRNTKANRSYQTVPYGPPGPYWGGGFGGWGHRGGFGYWGGWGFPYDPGVDVVVRTNYDAYAEIVMLTPEQAAREPRSINASEVISHIGPEAAPPKPNNT